MLTVKQSTTYGFKSVHDLPTPPSSSRHSPPLSFAQENIHSLRQLPVPSRHSPSPPPQTMANQHRGLPPPAAMALPPQLTPTTVAPMPHHHHGSLSQQQQQQQPHHPPPSQVPQSHVHHTLPGTTLPTPTSQWQEESLRNWLQARSEEERTKQEEEKTKQENIRLEQRRLEVDILQHSIRGGIPPPMIPLVFAGMGRDGQLPQSVLEWMQQFMHNPQSHLPQLMPPQPVSPQHHRDPSVQSHGQYPPAAGAAVPSVPPPGQAPQGYGQHSGSPNRSRPLSIGHSMGGSNLPGLNTSIPLSHQGASNHMQGQMGQQEPGSGLYFHHWQPPTSHSGASTHRPASPSGPCSFVEWHSEMKRKLTYMRLYRGSSQEAKGSGCSATRWHTDRAATKITTPIFTAS
jgi:hypothetical protein